MIRNLLSVGGFTLLSRVAGFLTTAVQSAVMGAGEVSDAFFIAQRLPNSFRSIFGEGAFNAAYIPCYSQALEQEGADSAQEFRLAGVHAAAGLAARAFASGLGFHAAIRVADGAGPRRPPRQIRAGGHADAHNFSLSDVHGAVHAAPGHAQHARAFRAGGLRAGADECLRHRGDGLRLFLSQGE